MLKHQRDILQTSWGPGRIALTVFILIAASCLMLGMASPPSGGWNPDPNHIDIVRPEYPELTPLTLGSEPDLPETVFCMTRAGEPVYLPVEWKIEEVNLNRPGRVTIGGSLDPGGYKIDEPNLSVYFTLLLYGEDVTPEPLSLVFPPPIEPVYRLAVGGDMRELPFWNLEVECYTEDYESLLFPVEWSGDLNASTPGTYTLVAVPVVPPCFSPPNGMPSVAVVVGDPQPFVLSAAKAVEGGVSCALTPPVADYENIRLEYCDSSASWHSLSGKKQEDGRIRTAFTLHSGQSLLILGGKIHTDMPYQFRMRYQAVYSNTLSVRKASDGTLSFSLSGETGGKAEPPEHDNGLDDPTGGDRGGGDRDEQELPPLRQPAELPQAQAEPKPEAEAEPEPEVEAEPEPDLKKDGPPLVWEESTGTATRLTGARLDEMLAVNGVSALFEKQGVAVELPAELLKGLGLPEASLLEVEIEPLGPHAFRLLVTAAGQEVNELEGTVVRVPYDADEGLDLGGGLVCYDERGLPVCTAVYDGAANVLMVRITRAGTYRIANAPPADEAVPAAAADAVVHNPPPEDAGTVPDGLPGWGAAGAGVLLLGLCSLVRRLRR